MTHPNPPVPPQPLPPGRIQAKADILESNLYSHISKQNNPYQVKFSINREQFQDAVILKGLLQLFPRLKLKSQKILLLLRKMMTRTLPEGADLNIRKTLLAMPETEDPDLARLSVSLDIALTAKAVSMVISGVPHIPSRHGEIKKAFFDYEACPGQLMADGKIDFREINSYPIVKKGDELFFITPECQGKPGMTYDGQIVHAEEARPLDLNLMDGIDRIRHRDKAGRYLGYGLKAGRTGVVVLKRKNGTITDIGITSDLDVKRLDFTVGNIGTQYICPISMKIDTICNGFRIRALGTVEVNILDGGEIETDSEAKAKTIRSGSRITATEDILCAQCMQSVLTSDTGCITVQDELYDSTVYSRAFTFEKSRAPLTNNRLDCEVINIKGVMACGENEIYFGRRLFGIKKRLLDDLNANMNDTKLLEQRESGTLEEIHLELVRLTKVIRHHPRLLLPLKALILAAQTKDIKKLRAELAVIGKEMNTKEVIRIKKLLDTLESLPEKAGKLAEQKQALEYDMAETERRISELHLSMEVFLRRAATLRLFTGSLEADETKKPALFIESRQDRDTFVKIVGTWSEQEGFTVKQL